MALTLKDLLSALENPDNNSNLANTKETWDRISKGDKFAELGIESSELDDFLNDWISNNDYNDMI